MLGPGTLAGLTVGRVTPHYQWSRLVRGKLDGLSVEGVHVGLRLGVEEKPKPEAKPPLDLAQLVQTLRGVRGQIVPLQLDLKRLSLNATRAGKPAFTLESSCLLYTSDAVDE